MFSKLSDVKKGILSIIASAFFFALMALFIKLAGDIPTFQKCFFRNFFAMIIAIVALIKAGEKFKPGKGNVKYLVARSVAGGLGMICNFYAVDHCKSIADSSILNKLSPFFAIVFSAIIIKEVANKYEWFAVIVAFIGTVFVVKPGAGLSSFPALIGAIGGMFAGLAYTFVRKLGMRKEKGMIIVAFFSTFTTVSLLPFVIIDYSPMTLNQWIFLCLTGISAALGQVFITKAYSHAPARKISVYDFSIVIFSAILGFVFIGQVPDYLSIIGYAIIVGTAIWQWYRNTR